ncbi:MAG TPA: hypothetical protein PK299_05530 [Anaerolineales bacterium]|nr:hypothetical protein [Anaerolineales bacterium]
MNKKLLHTLSLMMVTICLSACSTNNPSGIAKQWMTATLTADGATTLKLTCESMRETVQMQGLLSASFSMLFQTQGMNSQDAKTDLSDIKFDTVERKGDNAVVNVSGEVIVSFLGAAMPQEINESWVMVREDGDWKWCGVVTSD